MSVQFLGFGRWSNNCLLSFIEDSQFPIPFCQKVDVTNSVNTKERSWRRRVDINMAFYLGMLIAFSTLNIIYSSLEVSISYFNLRRSFVIISNFNIYLQEFLIRKSDSFMIIHNMNNFENTYSTFYSLTRIMGKNVKCLWILVETCLGPIKPLSQWSLPKTLLLKGFLPMASRWPMQILQIFEFDPAS